MTSRNLARWTFLIAALVVVLPTAVTRLTGQAPARAAGIVALRGATILTVTHGAIPNGTIVLRDGKIAAVGANVAIPANAEVVDVSGKFISPGLIDCHSHIANDDINEGGTTVSSMTGMRDVLDPTDINIYRDLAGGLTTANVLHGSANPIGGKNQVIKLRWGKTRAEDLVFAGALPGIKFALGENPKDHAAVRPGGAATVSGHAHGRRVRDSRRLHAREGLSEGVAGLREEEGRRTGRRRAASAICSSSRSSKSWRASAWCTRTAIAPTKS